MFLFFTFGVQSHTKYSGATSSPWLLGVFSSAGVLTFNPCAPAQSFLSFFFPKFGIVSEGYFWLLLYLVILGSAQESLLARLQETIWDAGVKLGLVI